MNKLINTIFYQLYFQNAGNNFTFSPASYFSALHNLATCVKGENLSELVKGLEVKAEDFNSSLEFKKQLSKKLNTFDTLIYNKDYRPALISRILEKLSLLDCYIKSFDLRDLDAVVNRVNELVTKHTNGKINNLISKTDLDDWITAIILNCVSFKKNWSTQFSEKWNVESFFGAEQQEIKFLNLQTQLRFYEDDSLDIIELRYQQSSICCYLMIPKKNNLLHLAHTFNEQYGKIKSVIFHGNTEVDLTVPPFKIETTLELGPLTKLGGISSIFNGNKDWSLFDFNLLDPYINMAISRIIQKAYFDFSKDGCEAAAATTICITGYISGCFMGGKQPPVKYVRADKPFIYVLADNNDLETPLFMGVVNKV